MSLVNNEFHTVVGSQKAIELQLLNALKKGVDVTNTTVFIRYKKIEDPPSPTVEDEATIVTASKGIVKYQFEPDVLTVGEYEAQFKVLYASGEDEYFPRGASRIRIFVEDSL
jgi:hypothetical protein